MWPVLGTGLALVSILARSGSAPCPACGDATDAGQVGVEATLLRIDRQVSRLAAALQDRTTCYLDTCRGLKGLASYFQTISLIDNICAEYSALFGTKGKSVKSIEQQLQVGIKHASSIEAPTGMVHG